MSDLLLSRDERELIISVLRAVAQPQSPADIRWQHVNDEPFEYAIQQGRFGDEFIKLLNGTCLRRALGQAQKPQER